MGVIDVKANGGRTDRMDIILHGKVESVGSDTGLGPERRGKKKGQPGRGDVGGTPDKKVRGLRQVDFAITGMTCAACAARVERALANEAGVAHAAVNLAAETARVQYDPDQTSPDRLFKAIEAAGYGAREAARDAEEDARRTEERKQQEINNWRLFYIGAAFSIPLVVGMIADIFGIEALMFLIDPFVGFVLATPVVFVPGSRFYISAARTVAHGGANMDVLVALGTGAAYILSVVHTFIVSGPVYYEAAAVVITLVLLGKNLEHVAKGKTSEAIRKLAALSPKTASVLQADGTEIQVPVDEVEVGDILIVRPGERVPVDGVIIEGFSAIDESMLTGESIPVDRQAGDAITGGTVNGHGMLKMRATRVGSETALAQIIRMVEEAQGSKAPIQRLADVVSYYFVPAVLVVAVVTFAGWMAAGIGASQALVNATAVLVIACPCALGLATPTAIMVATGRGAELGILIRGGEHLERLSSVKAVVLDKTGTITAGVPSLEEVEVFAPHGREEALRLAASAERASEHPLGRAIVEAAEQAGIDIPMPDEFRTVPGRGIVATVEGRQVAVGTLRFLDELGVSVDREGLAAERRFGSGLVAGTAEEMNGAGSEVPVTSLIAAGAVGASVARMQDEGRTAVVQAVDGAVAAVYGIADQVRPGSVEAIKGIQDLGIDVYMITGDNARTAAAIAERVGIPKPNVLAEVLPEDKAREVERLQEAGLAVAMVGDGINDAPALATADVGVAMSTGTDVAMEAADITIVGNLGKLLDAIKLAKKTITIIKENLFWAFVYNTIGIPLAAFGVLPPVYAGAAMSLSSVSVVSNSLRLRGFGKERPRGISRTEVKGVDNMPYGRKSTSDSKENMVAGPGSTEKSAAAAGMVGDYSEALLNVAGMSCGHCKAAVEGALMGVVGVESAEVDLEAKSARVVYDRNAAKPADLVRAVEDAGYEVLR